MTINEFIEALKELKIDIDDNKLELLNKYYELLIEWNNKINLTGITDKKEVYLKHFYDSLTLNRVIDLNAVNTLCDIGTGAGFPGIVIKIMFPNINVTLVDSLNKRINFLNEVIFSLKLNNIKTICARAEEYSINNRELYDVVTARAVASLPILLEYSIPLVKVNGYFIAMKGNLNEELVNITPALNKLNARIVNKDEFLLPFEKSNRTLIQVQKDKITDQRFPRKYSEIKKKPL